MSFQKTDSGRLMKHARRLTRQRLLTAAQFQVLDTLVFACRTPGRPSLTVSYTKLCALTGRARATIAGAIKRLVELKLIHKIKHGRMVVWAGGMAWRQMPNIYVFHSEYAPQPVLRELYIEKERGLGEKAREALGDLLAQRRRLFESGLVDISSSIRVTR